MANQPLTIASPNMADGLVSFSWKPTIISFPRLARKMTLILIGDQWPFVGVGDTSKQVAVSLRRGGLGQPCWRGLLYWQPWLSSHLVGALSPPKPRFYLSRTFIFRSHFIVSNSWIVANGVDWEWCPHPTSSPTTTAASFSSFPATITGHTTSSSLG